MAQIIQFPARAKEEQAASNGYQNLAQFIALAATVKQLNFYMETAEYLEKTGKLLDGEGQKLIEQGRAKRLEMAKPDPVPKEVAEAAGLYSYTPEVGQEKPDCQMEAHRGYYGGHWYIDTPLEIKGRGIQFLKKYQENDFCAPGNYRVGWNEYRVTNRAFEKLKENYSISTEVLLD